MFSEIEVKIEKARRTDPRNGGRFVTNVTPKNPFALLRTCKRLKDEAEDIVQKDSEITYLWADRWRFRSSFNALIVPIFSQHFYQCVLALNIIDGGRGPRSHYLPLAFLDRFFPNLKVVEYLHFEPAIIAVGRIHRPELGICLDEIAESNEPNSTYNTSLMSLPLADAFGDPLATAKSIIPRILL